MSAVFAESMLRESCRFRLAQEMDARLPCARLNRDANHRILMGRYVVMPSLVSLLSGTSSRKFPLSFALVRYVIVPLRGLREGVFRFESVPES